VVPDDLVDDEAQEFLAEIGIELRIFCQFAQSRDLAFLPPGIGRGKVHLRLVGADRLGDAEALRQDMDQRGIDVVDAGAVSGQDGIGSRLRVLVGPGSRIMGSILIHLAVR